MNCSKFGGSGTSVMSVNGMGVCRCQCLPKRCLRHRNLTSRMSCKAFNPLYDARSAQFAMISSLATKSLILLWSASALARWVVICPSRSVRWFGGLTELVACTSAMPRDVPEEIDGTKVIPIQTILRRRSNHNVRISDNLEKAMWPFEVSR